MTEKGNRTRSVVLGDALDRAIMAGLRPHRSEADDEWPFEVGCPVCGATLMLSGGSERPTIAARRLDAFTLRHRVRDNPDPDEPGGPGPVRPDANNEPDDPVAEAR
jgi:hypothetical protein